MDARAADIRAGTAPELVWLLEHPPLYTAGTSAKPRIFLKPNASLSTKPDAAANMHITAPASRWPMCSLI